MWGFIGTRGQPSLVTLGDRSRDKRDWNVAVALYSGALARDLRNAPLWVQYGHALKESGKLQDPAKLAQAEAAYRRALIYAPRVADTHLQLGHVLKLRGRINEAKAAYLRALALDPAFAAARDELRALGWEEGDGTELQAALASLDGVAVPRRRRPSLIERADAARDATQWALAARCYRAVLERDPGNAAIWVQYGHALKEAGNLKDPARLAAAEAAYRRAITLKPGIADPYFQLGHVLKLQSKTEEAQAAYLRAFMLDPSMPYPLQELGGLSWSRAQLSELRAMLDSAVPLPANRAELTPNDEPSRPRDPTKPRESNGATQPPNLHSSVIAGSFDSLTGTIAAGWAWNPSDPDKPVEVKFCVGDKIVGSCRTRTSRHDVKAAGYAPGPCGFETELQLDLAANEAIEVHARVVETGAELVNSPRTPAEPPPPMARLVRKQRVTGTFLTRLRSRLNRETDGLLSIVMPVYNTKEEWLRQAIESVRAQWCTRWELLCIDDGSSERHVQKVIKAYAAQDDRIRYFRRKTNEGIAKATNIGIFAAEGTYIAFMDHDDYLEPDAIYWLLRSTRTGAKLIYSDEIATGRSINSLLATSATPSFSYDFYLSHPYFVHIVCVERSLARNIGGWDETMNISGDVDFVLRVLQHADSVAHVPRILYRWRIHPGSAGHEMRPHVTAATLGALNRHLSQVFPGAYATEGVIHNQHKINFPDDSGKTTIVIRTQNREDLLRRCIESIWTTTNPDDVQLVVIDHASDCSAVREYVNSIVSKIQIIPCFSRSNISIINNHAISRISAHSSYLLFMDSGIEAIERGWLERLRSIANRPDVGVVGATLVDSHCRIWHSGVIIGLNGSADRGHKSSPYLEAMANGTRNPGYLASLVSMRDYSAVTAECMMMRWEVFDRVGGFDENFAVSYYDIDLCLRTGRLGLKILTDPYAVLYFREDAVRSLDQSGDRAFFCDRWKDVLRNGDPFYNPLLTLSGIGHSVDNRPAIGGGARVIPVSPPGRGPVPEVVQTCHAPSRRAPDGAAIAHRAHRERLGTFRVVYVSGEPETPGHRYRVTRPIAAAATLGVWATWMKVCEIPGRLGEIEAADAVILWRVPWDEHVALCVDAVRRGNAKIVFDVDDLMIDPTLARLEIIDGIRTHNLPENLVQEHFGRIRSTMLAADLCVATTDELAAHMRRAWKPAVVLPNTFDYAVLEASRLAVRRRGRLPNDSVVRIGYAGGSRTHQRDFAQCADAVAHVLRQNPQCQLVAFRSSDSSIAVLDTDEFPALRGLENRIEWRNFVPLERLPDEVARFDINLAPLEVGNPFCEAKSELKFFEAALSGVVTIASATGPFRRAIRNGETGFLASTPTEWRAALENLVADSLLRRRISAAAFRDVLWSFGPEQQTERMSLFFELLRGEREAARAFELGVLRQRSISRVLPPVPAHELVFETDHLSTAKVTVVVPLYNYAAFVAEALDSVAAQTLQELDLIIVDDYSTDDSLRVALGWVNTNANRFNRVLVFRNSSNSGLGLTRNVGFDAAETPFVLPLDPDNRLLPDCATACLEAVQRTGAAFAYPVIRQFGAAEGLLGTLRYDPVRLSLGNYIDAMAIVAKSVWLMVGGYEHLRTGWEDFDLWCKFAERGFRGVQVPGRPFAEYRVHSNSMTQTVNNRPGPARAIMKRLEERHAWLTLMWPLPYSSREGAEDDTLSKSAPCHGQILSGPDRLIRLLPILRCPETGGRLTLTADGGSLLSEDNLRRWPLVLGRPMLFPGMDTPKVNPDSHLSNELPESALALIRNTPGLILHLSAGGTKVRFDNVIEAEAAVFRHTDLIADVHRLPLADGAFDAVIALNAFEHYRDPGQATREIYRVLRPGGRVLIRTAFLQPLHEAPWHFYNCTRYGLEAWFEGFETEKLHVSDNFHAGYSLSWLASECESALREQISSDAADVFLSAELRDILALWRRPEERVGAGASLWGSLSALPQHVQETVAAGFEYVGRRP